MKANEVFVDSTPRHHGVRQTIFAQGLQLPLGVHNCLSYLKIKKLKGRKLLGKQDGRTTWLTSAADWRPDHQSHSVISFEPERTAQRPSGRNDPERVVRARLNPRVLFTRDGRAERTGGRDNESDPRTRYGLQGITECDVILTSMRTGVNRSLGNQS